MQPTHPDPPPRPRTPDPIPQYIKEPPALPRRSAAQADAPVEAPASRPLVHHSLGGGGWHEQFHVPNIYTSLKITTTIFIFSLLVGADARSPIKQWDRLPAC